MDNIALTLQRFVCILTLQKSVLEQTNHLEYLGLVADTAHASVFFPFFFFLPVFWKILIMKTSLLGQGRIQGPLPVQGTLEESCLLIDILELQSILFFVCSSGPPSLRVNLVGQCHSSDIYQPSRRMGALSL